MRLCQVKVMPSKCLARCQRPTRLSLSLPPYCLSACYSRRRRQSASTLLPHTSYSFIFNAVWFSSKPVWHTQRFTYTKFDLDLKYAEAVFYLYKLVQQHSMHRKLQSLTSLFTIFGHITVDLLLSKALPTNKPRRLCTKAIVCTKAIHEGSVQVQHTEGKTRARWE